MHIIKAERIVKMQIIYADVLLLINFSMDFLSLAFCGRLLHAKRRRIFLLLGALIGAGYALAAALLPGNSRVSLLLHMAVSVLMCFVSYGGCVGRRRFFALCALFYGVSFLFGGMLTAFYQLLNAFLKDRRTVSDFLTGGEAKITVFFLLTLLSAWLIRLSIRFFSVSRATQSVELLIENGGKNSRFPAMVDSGNHLRDPLTGRACIVVSPQYVRKLLPADVLRLSESGTLNPAMLSPESRRRIRLIPAESLGGSQLLIGYAPDGIRLTDNKETYRADAVLVLSGKENSFNGFGAIVPAALIS